MRALRSYLFLALWCLLTLAAGVVCLPLLLSRTLTRGFCSAWVCTTLWLVRVCCGVRCEVSGTLPEKPYMVASAHQSALDTFLLWKALNGPLFIMKRELLLIPIYGWYVWRAGQIAINRNARTKPMQHIIACAQQAMQEGRVLVIFPEGTRLPPGATKPYQRGIGTLSHALHAPVVPVALNTGHFWPKGTLLKTPGRAQLRFLPPVEACGEQRDGWVEALQARIRAEVFTD